MWIYIIQRRYEHVSNVNVDHEITMKYGSLRCFLSMSFVSRLQVLMASIILLALVDVSALFGIAATWQWSPVGPECPRSVVLSGAGHSDTSFSSFRQTLGQAGMHKDVRWQL